MLGTYSALPERAENAAALGYGTDPNDLGTSFVVYYTYLQHWADAEVRTFNLTCRQ